MNPEQIPENTAYDPMPFDDLVFEGGTNVGDFVEELRAMYIDNFVESTPRSDYHFQQLDIICENLKHINIAMEGHIKNNAVVDIANVEAVLDGIDMWDTPSLLIALRILLKKREEEIYDRPNICKYCQAYDRLAGEFRSYLAQLKLIAKNKNVDSQNPRPSSMKIKRAFTAIGKERLFQKILKDSSNDIASTTSSMETNSLTN
jgi:hypothetical protein